jgi:predicted transcriptional regulator
MEQYKKFSWEELVKKATLKRKELNFTQKRLALLAEVSTPTISRFENMDQDMKLSSALAILKALGIS